jgi:hypothetical protein
MNDNQSLTVHEQWRNVIRQEYRARAVFLNALRTEQCTSATSTLFALRVQSRKEAELLYDRAMQQTEKAFLVLRNTRNEDPSC